MRWAEGLEKFTTCFCYQRRVCYRRAEIPPVELERGRRAEHLPSWKVLIVNYDFSILYKPPAMTQSVSSKYGETDYQPPKKSRHEASARSRRPGTPARQGAVDEELSSW